MSEEISKWLDELGLSRYDEQFANQEVVFEDLVELNEDDLKELGIPLGPRKRILKAAATLAEAESSEVSESANSSGPNNRLASWDRHPDERKPATILFADVTGSTALTEHLDAEDTHDLLDGVRQRMCTAVANHRGTLCRVMGDGIMAVFGAPVASEHHAVEACEAALEMQQAVRDYAGEIEARHGSGLKIRVGLHSGEIVVLTGGEGDKVEYDADGPAVPIAARMEQSAEPGMIYMTGATQSLAGNRIETKTLAPVTVKGISEPVPVFSLHRVRPADEPILDATRTPFVGRRTEINQFASILTTCIEEGYGQTVYVRGEPGIGKTRLVEEFTRIAMVEDVSCHRGLVLPFGVGKGQDAIRSLVRSLLNIPAGSGEAERQRAASTALKDEWLDQGQAVFLNDLLDLPQPTELQSLYDAMENEKRNEGKQTTVVRLVDRVSRLRPILVIVEDIHWADTIVLAHLATIAKTAGRSPVLLVMTSRVEGDPLDQGWRGSAGGSPFSSMDLGPLREDESIALIGRVIDSADPLAEDCLRRAAGNPLFLEQLLQNAQEGFVDGLPDSIQSLVLARVDRLSPTDKQALQAASVIGQRFELGVLRHVAKVSTYDCQGLLEQNLVRLEGVAYLFAHSLIQEGVYASLIKQAKRDLHERAAGWFQGKDSVLQAEHLDRAENPTAPSIYLKACREQASQYRYERALELVTRGLQLARGEREEAMLACAKGELLHDMGSIDSSINAYEHALKVTTDDAERCRACIGIADGLRVKNEEATRALKLLEEAETLAVNHNFTNLLSRLHHLRGNLMWTMGDFVQCRAEHEIALKNAREADLREYEAWALGGLGDAYYGEGRMLTALKHYRQCLSACEENGFGRIAVAHRSMVADILFELGEIDSALEEFLESAEIAKKVGHLRAEVLCQQGICYTLLRKGNYDGAREALKRAKAITVKLGAKGFEASNLKQEAELLYLEGRREEALMRLQESISISRNIGMSYVGPTSFGKLALMSAAPATKRRALEDGETLLGEGAVSYNFFEFYCDAIDVCVELGNWDDVDRYADALEAFTRQEPLPSTNFHITRGHTLAAFGRGKRDKMTESELRRLHDEAERMGMKHYFSVLEDALLEF